MKKLNLLFALLLTSGLSAQSTVHITGCSTFWKDGTPVTGFGLAVAFAHPNFPVPTTIFPGDTTNGCLTVAIPTASIPAGTTAVGVGPMKDVSPLNGVTVMDMDAIAQHILGLEPLPWPYAMIAADVNKSGSITTFDIVEIRKLIIGEYTKFPQNASWRFVDSGFAFPDPLNPFKTAFPESVVQPEVVNLDGDTLNFVGIKVGDVTGDAEKKGKKYKGPITTDSMTVLLPDTLLPGGLSEVLVPVYITAPSGSVRALQLEFRPTHPAVKIVDMTPGTLSLGTANSPAYSASPSGIARTALSGSSGSSALSIFAAKPVFHLVLRVESLEPIPLKYALSLGADSFPCFAAKGNKAYRFMLRFDDSTSSIFSPAANTLRATPAMPNPFTDKALVQIELTETSPVLLEVFGLDGRLLWSAEQTLPAGWQTLEIPSDALAHGSTGLYRVRAGSGVATGKVMRQ